MSAGFLLLLNGSDYAIFSAALLIALGNGLMWPSVMGLISKHAGSQHQGAVQGFASSTGAIASIVGLTLGGILYNWIQSWAFAASAMTIILVAVVMLTMHDDENIDI